MIANAKSANQKPAKRGKKRRKRNATEQRPKPWERLPFWQKVICKGGRP
jgi:hypothetical protein